MQPLPDMRRLLTIHGENVRCLVEKQDEELSHHFEYDKRVEAEVRVYVFNKTFDPEDEER